MIGPEVEGGEKCRCQELFELQQGDLEVTGINSWSAKREIEVDVGELKRRVESDEGARAKLKFEMGRPKFRSLGLMSKRRSSQAQMEL